MRTQKLYHLEVSYPFTYSLDRGLLAGLLRECLGLPETYHGQPIGTSPAIIAAQIELALPDLVRVELCRRDDSTIASQWRDKYAITKLHWK